MPELPEVETVRLSLEPYLLNHMFIKIVFLHPKSFINREKQNVILGQKIIAVQRHAKIIDLVFVNNWHLLVHLKMTGQLLYRKDDLLAGGGHPTSDVLKQLPGKHTRLIFYLNDQSRLFFNDQRLFGWVKVCSQQEVEALKQNFGPEAHEKISLTYLEHKLAHKRQAIKTVLMDNKIIAGIGNIYANEILFASGILPDRSAQSLTRVELQKILKAMPKIMRQAIKAGGTTFDGRYLDSQANPGNYQEQLSVYGRAHLPCLQCGELLLSKKINGRGSIYCLRCQR